MRRPATSAASWTDLGNAARDEDRRRVAGSRSIPAAGRRRFHRQTARGGDLLRPRRLRRLPGQDGAAFEVAVRGLHRAPGARAAHAAADDGRPRRARLRHARRRPRSAISRARASAGSAAPGRGRDRRPSVGARGRSRRAGGAASSARGRRASSTSTTSRASAERPAVKRLARAAGAELHRAELGDASTPGEGAPPHLPLGGGGDLRRARRRGRARALADAERDGDGVELRGARRSARATSSRGRRASGIAHGLPRGRGRADLCSSTARAGRTTSATTRARTRSSSAASA